MASKTKSMEATIAEAVALAVAAAMSASGTGTPKGKVAKVAKVAPTVPSMFRWRGVSAAKPGGTFRATLKSGESGQYQRHTLAEATAILVAQYESGIFYASRV